MQNSYLQTYQNSLSILKNATHPHLNTTLNYHPPNSIKYHPNLTIISNQTKHKSNSNGYYQTYKNKLQTKNKNIIKSSKKIVQNLNKSFDSLKSSEKLYEVKKINQEDIRFLKSLSNQNLIIIEQQPQQNLIDKSYLTQSQQNSQTQKDYAVIKKKLAQQYKKMVSQIQKIKIKCQFEQRKIKNAQQQVKEKKKKLAQQKKNCNSKMEKQKKIDLHKQNEQKKVIFQRRLLEQTLSNEKMKLQNIKTNSLTEQINSRKQFQQLYQRRINLLEKKQYLKFLRDQNEKKYNEDLLFLQSVRKQSATIIKQKNELQKQYNKLIEKMQFIKNYFIQSEESNKKQGRIKNVMRLHNNYLSLTQKVFICKSIEQVEVILKNKLNIKQNKKKFELLKREIQKKKEDIDILNKKINRKKQVVQKLQKQMKQKTVTLLQINFIQ